MRSLIDLAPFAHDLPEDRNDHNDQEGMNQSAREAENTEPEKPPHDENDRQQVDEQSSERAPVGIE